MMKYIEKKVFENHFPTNYRDKEFCEILSDIPQNNFKQKYMTLPDFAYIFLGTFIMEMFGC